MEGRASGMIEVEIEIETEGGRTAEEYVAREVG